MRRLDSILQAINEAPRGMRLDAGENLAFARELEHVESTVYSALFPAVAYRTLFRPVTDMDPDAMTHTYTATAPAGEAKIITDMANDFPTVALSGAQSSQPLRPVGASYQYTLTQMRRAAKLGYGLPTELAVAAREMIERKVDSIVALGDTATGIPGFVNASGITAVTATTKTSGGLLWTGFTGGATGAQAGEIAKDFSALVAALRTGTANVFGGNAPVVVAFGDVAWTWLQTTYVMGTNYPPQTTFMDLLKRTPGVSRVEYWPQLNAAGASGVGRVMAWIDDSRVAGLLTPSELEVHDPQPRNFAWVCNMFLTTGGVVLRHPKGVAYMDGVTST